MKENEPIICPATLEVCVQNCDSDVKLCLVKSGMSHLTEGIDYDTVDPLKPDTED